MKKIFLIIISILIISYLLFLYYIYQNQNKMYLNCINRPTIGYSQEMIKISQNDCQMYKQSLVQIIFIQQTKFLPD